MSNLVISLLTIAFMSASLWVGTNQINYKIYDQRLTESKITSDFKTYESAIMSYKQTINIYPTNENWESELMVLGFMIPKNTGEYRYSYTPNPSNPDYEMLGMCYTEKIEVDDFFYIKEIHEKGITVLSENCFDLNDSAIDESGDKVSFALTQWIKGDWSFINTGNPSPVVPIIPDELDSGKDREDSEGSPTEPPEPEPITPEPTEPEPSDPSVPIEGNPNEGNSYPSNTDSGLQFLSSGTLIYSPPFSLDELLTLGYTFEVDYGTGFVVLDNQEAVNFCNTFEYEGWSNWRLTTNDELKDLYSDYGSMTAEGWSVYREYWTDTPSESGYLSVSLHHGAEIDTAVEALHHVSCVVDNTL